jgi:DNA polymerase-3 subunit alpha
LRIHLSPAVAELGVIRSRLEPSESGGEVTVVAAFGGGREVEMKLPGRYRLDPAVRGAIKVAPGVAALEDV